MAEVAADPVVDFETHPSRYKRIKLLVDGPIGRIRLAIPEDAGLRPGYELKLNSYDLGVDIELADAVQRLRFEHPEVRCVVVDSALEGCFSAGANIFMLGTSSHRFKVNFCKFTNETRLYLEDATKNSNQTYIAAVNGVCSGGGYELALACEKIFLIEDRRSAVALPEVPFLGVLPGTGGLTRVVDKRKIRRDRADVFCSLAEGLKGKRAKEWGFVDDVYPASRFNDEILARAKEIAGKGNEGVKGIELEALKPTIDDQGMTYQHVEVRFGPTPRTARLTMKGPSQAPVWKSGENLPSTIWPIRAFRELDDAILRLRLNHPDIGLVLISTRGEPSMVKKVDADLAAAMRQGHWQARETVLLMRRVLKRVDLTAKSFFSLVDADSCFVGSLYELALASDRAYMLDKDGVRLELTELNNGALPMSNGWSRLRTHLLADPEAAERLGKSREPFNAEQAALQGLVTVAVDELDWDDEIRLATEERASLSPDSLTGMEANLRFAGPETMETKIFGRLSAWQNWIFQRPNAVGERGALKLYGSPEQPVFDWSRT